MDKAKMDHTTYPFLPFETFIFNVTPTIIHSHSLFFVTNSHSLQKVIQPSLEKCHPKGLFQTLCVFQLETRLNTSWFLWPQNMQSTIEATVITDIIGKYYFLLSCLVAQCHWGTIRLVYGLSYFICRHLVKQLQAWETSQEYSAFHSVKILLFISSVGKSGSPSTILCLFLIWNNPFSLKFPNLTLSWGLCPFPLLLHIHFLLP